MSGKYQIVEVNPKWMVWPEEMGSKRKFWYQPIEDPGSRWLFKYPQEGAGQHWAEKIAAEVASVLQVHHATVELATYKGAYGSVAQSFATQGRSLHHGNQLLEVALHDYDGTMTYNQSHHTLINIFKTLEKIFLLPTKRQEVKLQLASYMVLDALIGNVDRHHENWGILSWSDEDQWSCELSPSFDHASSLGRELLDERRDKYLEEDRVKNYSGRGRGAIYWSNHDRNGPSPVELVRRGTDSFPDIFGPALKDLNLLHEQGFSEIVNRIPESWMSSSARQFAIALMCYNHRQLQELV